MSKSQFEIDSKDMCLLCLSSDNCRIFSENDGCGENSECGSRTPTAFKRLLRYLKVDVDMTNLTLLASTSVPPVTPNPELANVNLKVTLCEDCSSVTNDFLDLYQTFDSIRLQLDLCVRQLHSFMEKGGQDSDRILEYERRSINENAEDVIWARFADNLRKQTLEKASRRVRSSLPFPRIIRFDDLDSSRTHRVMGDGHVISSIQTGPSKTGDIFAEEHPQQSEMERQYSDVIGNSSVDLSLEEGEPVDIIDITDIGSVPSPNVSEEGSHIGGLNESSEGDINFQQEVQESPSKSPRFKTQWIDPWKCVPCRKSFWTNGYLPVHQLCLHTVTHLSRKGHLPPGTSEEQFENTVTAFIKRENPSDLKCRLCNKTGFGKWKWHLRRHLLQRHLQEVLGMVVRRGPEVIGTPRRTTTPSLEKRRLFECCGKSFSTKKLLDRHKLLTHTITFLKERGILPLGVTQHHIDKSLTIIIRQNRSPYNCPICKENGFQGNISCVRTHLLESHLSRILVTAEKLYRVTARSNDVNHRRP